MLVHLQRAGTASVRDIVTYVNLEKPRVSRAVARLEAEGLVAKAPDDGDARLVRISLTAAGQGALAEILPKARKVESGLLSAVPPDDLNTFFAVMERLHLVLDADPEARPRSPMDMDGVAV